MSLLLDALKKAADDKQKTAQENIDAPAANSTDVNQRAAISQSKTTGIPQQAVDENSEPLSDLVLDDQQDKTSVEEELTLEDVESSTVAEQRPIEETDVMAVNEIDADIDTEVAAEVTTKVDVASIQQAKNAGQSKAAITAVSDEALSMLINKTNRDAKQWKRTVYISIFLVSLITLVSGGVYYYLDMQTEIDELNRRHRIAMQAMLNKTSQQEVQQPSAIIRNLVSDADLDDKVVFTKKQINNKKPGSKKPGSKKSGSKKPGINHSKTGSNNVSNKAVQPKKKINKKVANSKMAATSVSFQKTNKVDPVSEKLEEAWQNYEVGQYGLAKKLYTEVLQLEKDNRDALLGLGAIAVIEKNNVMAREVYRDLLRMDPRDPVAIAALTALQSNSLSLEENEKYLLEILQSNPDAAELNFALASNYAQQEKWKAAQQYYFSAWQHDAENADYLFNLAVSLDQLGKSSQAIRFYSDSLKYAKNRQVGFSRQAVQKRIAVLSAL
jgi:tetratricopeptide (TPR) repeat protein